MKMAITQMSHSSQIPPDKPIEFITVKDEWWPGQMKHIIWFETHNEDCDAILPSDQDWDNQHEGEI